MAKDFVPTTSGATFFCEKCGAAFTTSTGNPPTSCPNCDRTVTAYGAGDNETRMLRRPAAYSTKAQSSQTARTFAASEDGRPVNYLVITSPVPALGADAFQVSVIRRQQAAPFRNEVLGSIIVSGPAKADAVAAGMTDRLLASPDQRTEGGVSRMWDGAGA